VAKKRDAPTFLSPIQPFEPEMILIPAGRFLMGSDPSKDKDAHRDEQPQHKLYLSDYYIASNSRFGFRLDMCKHFAYTWGQ
jgi:formylglycine-generating enzyme required for sulfatase activity